jgi:hypothetical protein
VSGLDLSQLSPGDAVAALRSYPRRYRALMTGIDEDERPDDLLHRPGPDGRSAVEVAADATRAIASWGAAIRSILVDDRPSLSSALFAETGPESALTSAPAPTSVDAVLDQLALEAEAVADQASRVDPADWRRAGVVADGSGREVTALDALKGAVRAGYDGLRSVERAIEAARRG